MKAHAPVLKTALITLLIGGDRPSPLPFAARACGLLLAGCLLAGCASSEYELPQHVTEPAMIGGGDIFSADQSQWARLYVTSVDGDPLLSGCIGTPPKPAPG